MPSINEIVALVASTTGISRDEIMGISRARHCARPRHMAMTLAREFTNFSLPQLGTKFYRDHTSILHGIRVMKGVEASVPFIRAQMAGMRSVLRGDAPAENVAVEASRSVSAENQLRKQWSVSAALTTVAGGM